MGPLHFKCLQMLTFHLENMLLVTEILIVLYKTVI